MVPLALTTCQPLLDQPHCEPPTVSPFPAAHSVDGPDPHQGAGRSRLSNDWHSLARIQTTRSPVSTEPGLDVTGGGIQSAAAGPIKPTVFPRIRARKAACGNSFNRPTRLPGVKRTTGLLLPSTRRWLKSRADRAPFPTPSYHSSTMSSSASRRSTRGTNADDKGRAR